MVPSGATALRRAPEVRPRAPRLLQAATPARPMRMLPRGVQATPHRRAHCPTVSESMPGTGGWAPLAGPPHKPMAKEGVAPERSARDDRLGGGTRCKARHGDLSGLLLLAPSWLALPLRPVRPPPRTSPAAPSH